MEGERASRGEPALEGEPAFPAGGDGPSPALAEVASEGIPSSPTGKEAQSADITPLLAGLAPEGWGLLGEVERFTADNLYEKINGRAEQYLAYDVLGLTCVSLANSAEQFIDLYVYDMGGPTRAFGIYSVERQEGQPAIDVGRGGYRVKASYFFWKGPYYVQVLASEAGEPFQRIGADIARSLADGLVDNGEPVWGLGALPQADRIPGTVQYFMRDALSLDFLSNTYTARYRKGDAEITGFLSRQPSAGAASDVLDAYQNYLKKYGELVGRSESDGTPVITGSIGGVFDVVFRRGELVGGVTSVADRSLAERAALDFLNGLGENGRE